MAYVYVPLVERRIKHGIFFWIGKQVTDDSDQFLALSKLMGKFSSGSIMRIIQITTNAHHMKQLNGAHGVRNKEQSIYYLIRLFLCNDFLLFQVNLLIGTIYSEHRFQVITYYMKLLLGWTNFHQHKHIWNKFFPSWDKIVSFIHKNW